MKRRITIGLAGNPNSGKTTVFNNITGARHKVANYPGVTVESKEGHSTHNGVEIRIVDLPGTYSLTAYSIEELVARNFIVDEKIDVVVDIIDASNFERNMYLATQFIELGVPLLLALNMSDVAEQRGIEFDIEKLSGLMGAPVVKTVGNKNRGTKELLDAVLELVIGENIYSRPQISYGSEIDAELDKIQQLVENDGSGLKKYPPRWAAVKLLENDKEVMGKVSSKELISTVEQSSAHLENIFNEQPEIVIAEKRYGFISGIYNETVRSTVELRHSRSDKIDEVLMSHVFGLPIFLGLMYLTFYITFTLGKYPMEWIESLFGWLGGSISGWWPAGSESVLRSFLVDGLIRGVGGVIVFLPNILLLFLAIAFLEDTGYMARAAFIMDRVMHKMGLHGKSFVPMLIGFGCSVPAIMATRTLDTKRDRLITMLILPLMSCGARLPIYMLIISAFFAEKLEAPMLWVMYLIGIVVAIISAKILSKTLFKGLSTPFVMELPPYRMPTLKTMMIHMWDKGGIYLKKAGTIILVISIIMWAMTSFPKKEGLEGVEELEYSMAGRIGHGIEPVLKPMGFDWKIGTAMIGAFAAKEVFVAQMGIVYSVENADEKPESLSRKLRARYTPLVGFCIMLFALISLPCMATVAVTIRESGSWRWGLFQAAGLTILAYILTTIVYQLGTLLKIGTEIVI